MPLPIVSASMHTPSIPPAPQRKAQPSVLTADTPATAHVGRFAPSPTGLLHAGSLLAALASWLDARAHHGQWLIRIEDVDTPRCIAGADTQILAQLQRCGMVSDQPVVWQSKRFDQYQAALDQLMAADASYPCACSRKDIAQVQARQGTHAQRGKSLPYPGTCRPEHGGLRGQAARAWRFDTQWGSGEHPVHWCDRRLGPQSERVSDEVGDFVLLRADGLWAYQLAVVVDDAAQGVTHVVRGEDLRDNTARQILLQRALGLPQTQHLHTPLVLGDNGEKLSKQNGAMALDLRDPVHALTQAAQALGLQVQWHANSATDWLAQAIPAWRDHIAQWPSPITHPSSPL